MTTTEALSLRLLEMASEMAELRETIAELRSQVQRNGEIGAEVRDLLQAFRDQKPPHIEVTVPPAPPPAAAPAMQGCEITHHWEGNRCVRSTITRKGA